VQKRRSFAKKDEKHLFFCLQIRRIGCLLAIALRTFSPMSPHLRPEIFFFSRLAGTRFHRPGLVSGKGEPSAATLLLPWHFTGLSSKRDL
jgi:hypothetical protein